MRAAERQGRCRRSILKLRAVENDAVGALRTAADDLALFMVERGAADRAMGVRVFGLGFGREPFQLRLVIASGFHVDGIG